MEFIEERPSPILRGSPLTNRERIQLFLRVCAAVEHATAT